MIITDPYSFEGDIFEGELKIDLLTKFMNKYSYKQAAYEKKLDFIQLT
jgi:hypothetical protein